MPLSLPTSMAPYAGCESQNPEGKSRAKYGLAGVSDGLDEAGGHGSEDSRGTLDDGYEKEGGK